MSETRNYSQFAYSEEEKALKKWIRKNRKKLKVINNYSHMHVHFLNADPIGMPLSYYTLRRVLIEEGILLERSPRTAMVKSYPQRMASIEDRLKRLEQAIINRRN